MRFWRRKQNFYQTNQTDTTEKHINKIVNWVVFVVDVKEDKNKIYFLKCQLIELLIKS